jgi:hypothetical protein
MSDSNPPVAKLAGVTLPGHNRPADNATLRENVSVLRPAGGSWSSITPTAGMDIHAGDIIHLKGDPFHALGARAFTVGDSSLGFAPPAHLELMAHEASHVVQQGAATVTPVNDAEVDAAERAAIKVEEMVLHRPAGR